MRAAVLVAALLGTAYAQEPPAGEGPRGTSGAARDDSVGYAALAPADAEPPSPTRITVLHPDLPGGSFVELTALATGRTIVALVAGPSRGPAVVALSPGAAAALGVADGAAVRVRAVTPTPQEERALRTGQAVGARLDAPPVLLVALRRKLPRRATASIPPPRVKAVSAVRAASPTAARGSYGVRVAALSSADRAAALARMLNGHVVAAGRLYGVQLGPFGDAAAASRARDAAVRRGYGDARIFHSE